MLILFLDDVFDFFFFSLLTACFIMFRVYLSSENDVFIVAISIMGINIYACLRQKKCEQMSSFVTLGWKRDLYTGEHFKQTEH